MPIISIKPLSVNAAWKWRRFKTPEYKQYEKLMLLYLMPMKEIKVKGIYIQIWVSSRAFDIDNMIKPFLDILQKKYKWFNDRDLYELQIRKEIVKKKQEYIYFKFN